MEGRKVTLLKASPELYQMSLSFDHVYQILNEDNIPIGLIYLSDMEGQKVYIEWLEILTVFRGRGYLRKLFRELREIVHGKEIHFECGEELLRKYLSIGCTEHGISDCTENYRMRYI